jgi:predicted nucleotidyltransferase
LDSLLLANYLIFARLQSIILNESEQTAVHAFLQKLHQQYGDAIQQITLFGSKAGGESTPDSDIDVLIVVAEESWPLRDEISVIAARISLEYDVLLSPRIIGQQRWQRMMQDQFNLYKNVAKEGVPLAA